MPSQNAGGGVSHVSPPHGAAQLPPMHSSPLAAQSSSVNVYSQPSATHVPTKSQMTAVLPSHELLGGLKHRRPSHSVVQAPPMQRSPRRAQSSRCSTYSQSPSRQSPGAANDTAMSPSQPGAGGASQVTASHGSTQAPSKQTRPVSVQSSRASS